MKPLALLAGFFCGLLVAWAFGCGGGGSATIVGTIPATVEPTLDTPAFVELWEPRTAQNGVFGVVHDVPLVSTPDGSDPQTDWVNAITGKWGGLAWPDVSGLGNRFWQVNGGRLYFHGGGPDNFALITGQTFPRDKQIAVEADFSMTSGSPGAFAGLALIAGEGDYREIAIRRNGFDYIKRVTPLRETVLAMAQTGANTFRIEYDPHTGFRYLVNGQLVGTEAIDHEGASFASDPSVGLYFSGNSSVEGSVGPVRVWTSNP